MSIIPPWAKTTILVGIIATIFYAGRVYERRIWQRDTAVAASTKTKQDAAREVAGANFDAFLASAGTKTVTNYVERLEEDRPIVERVITRIRNVCLRGGASGVRRSVPEGAGTVQAPGSETRNGGDDAFAAALQRDLKVCAAELNRLDESARYLRIRDGEEQP